jgi:hypothetical protein
MRCPTVVVCHRADTNARRVWGPRHRYCTFVAGGCVTESQMSPTTSSGWRDPRRFLARPHRPYPWPALPVPSEPLPSALSSAHWQTNYVHAVTDDTALQLPLARPARSFVAPAGTQHQLTNLKVVQVRQAKPKQCRPFAQSSKTVSSSTRWRPPPLQSHWHPRVAVRTLPCLNFASPLRLHHCSWSQQALAPPNAARAPTGYTLHPSLAP